MERSRDLCPEPAGYWQDGFVQQNLLVLGYGAWSGYLERGAGVLICQLSKLVSPGITWQTEQVPFALDFKPPEHLLQILPGLSVAYDPEWEFLLLIQGNGLIEVLLVRPKVSPRECFRQVQQRHEEFLLSGFGRSEKSFA